MRSFKCMAHLGGRTLHGTMACSVGKVSVNENRGNAAEGGGKRAMRSKPKHFPYKHERTDEYIYV